MGFWDVTTMRILRKLGGDIKRSAPTVAIPKGSYEFFNGEYGAPSTQFPKAGDLVTLTLDGVVYSEQAKESTRDDVTYIYIGNGAMVGDDTGENYGAVYISSYEAWLVFLVDESNNQTTTTHTVELSFKTQTIVPIDPKFLPGVCLPVVEITTLPTLGAVPLSDAENAKLNEMAEIGTPFFAKIFLEGTALTAPVIVAEVEGMIVGYFLSLPREFGMSVGVRPAEDGWELFAEPVT